MEGTFSKIRARAATRTPSDFVIPALGVLLLGLLANLSSREEVYANPEYGFSVLAFLGAAGYIGHLATSISRRSVALDFACRVPIQVLPAAAVPGGIAVSTGNWPVLVALMFGPLVFLLSGLGGWV